MENAKNYSTIQLLRGKTKFGVKKSNKLFMLKHEKIC